jgi:hypothetical protein
MLVFLQGYVLYGVRGEITSLVLVFAMFFGTKKKGLKGGVKVCYAHLQGAPSKINAF